MQPDLDIVTSHDGEPIYFHGKCIRRFGMILSLMATATLVLGIADVILTVTSYKCSSGPCTGEPYIWTWVAIGIWASVPVLIAGMLAIYLRTNPAKRTKYFAMFIYLSAIVFLPGMITLSSIEVWRGAVASPNFYTVPSSLMVGSITPNPTNVVYSKFGIPIAIAVIGFVMFLMTGFMTLILCFCMQELGIYRPKEVETYDGAQWITIEPNQTQMRPPIFNRSSAANFQQYDQPSDTYIVGPSRPKFQNIIYNDQSINDRADIVLPDRPQIVNQYISGPGTRLPRRSLPTRYNSVPNPYGVGGLYGNFNAEPTSQPSSYMDSIVKPYMANFWK